MKVSKKVLAVILSALTVMGAFSVATPVVAAEVQAVYDESMLPIAPEPTEEDLSFETPFPDEKVFAGEDSSAKELNAEEAEPTILGEDEGRRTADTKHFIMSNGTRKAVIYGNAVHYEENGKWQEIDNTLSYDKEKEEYKNSKNSFKATFKKDFNAENMFSLENEGYTITWEYNGGALRKALTKAEYEEKKLSADKMLKYADKTQDKIKYKNFESNCELEYVVTPNGVKENIILNSKTGKNEFTFTVTAADLVLNKNQDGSISALNGEKEEIFHIPAPFMYDAEGVYSYDVSYTVEELSQGKYTVSIVADKEWLKDKSREYPVVIDPVIYTKQTSTSVSSTFVASDTPSTNYGSVQDIYIGDESANYGLCHAMFKNTLPTLNKGDMVVSAHLGLYLYSTSFDGGSSKRQLDAHIITSSWAENSVTWNTKPTYNTHITDYCFMNNGDNEWKYFDITKAVKGWYEGTFANHGILVKAHDETLTPARAIFRSENATNITQGIPYITIEYRNNKGIESYWSYSNFSNGVGGIASINEYTGNLVYTLPLTSSVSEILPVSLSLVYNTYCSNETYTAGKDNTNLTSVGKGWRLNYQQTLLISTRYGLTGEAAENYPYVYTDADGTEHYIAKFTENGQTVYKDEDGLGYTFSKPNGATDFYRLTKDDGSYLSFNNCGNLSAVVDNSGNRITITYDSYNLMIQKVTDGTGHTFTFNYTSGTNYLQSIKDNANRTTYFYISGGVLTDVKLIDSSQVYFRYYDTGENLLNYVWTTDKTGRRFTYTEQSKGRRVAQTFDFYATDVSLANYLIGQTVTFDRTAYNTTVIRSAGIDGIHNVTNANNGGDDIISTLQFDNFGRTVSQQVKYGNGESVGAGAYTYTGDNIEESRNRIQSSATLGKNTVNLLENGNTEGTAGWITNNAVGNVTYTYGATTEEAYVGKQSIKLTNTAVTGASYSYVAQSIGKIKEKHNYTYSAYVKTKNIKLSGATDNGGASLMMVAKGTDGSYKLIQNSSKINTSTSDSEDINGGWRRISMTMNIPENTSYIVIYMILGSATGTAYFDGFQLEEGSVASSLNLVQNSSFETYGSTQIKHWVPSEGVTHSLNNNGATTENVRNGSAALKITGGGEDYKGFYQYVTVSPNENDTYILSGWAAAFAVNKTHHPNSKFEIAARVTYSVSDGSTVTQFKESAVFNTTISTWQYAAASFSLKYKKANSSDTKTYTPTHIMVMPRYNLQGNFAYFDHIQLIRDVAQSYIYDSEGNVTSVSANAEQKNNMTYQGEDLKTYKDAAGYTSEYSYDSSHRLTQAKSPKGVKVNYTYNNQGLVLSTENVGGSLNTLATQSYTNAYQDNKGTNLTAGAYLSEVRDQHGYTTTYSYDMPTGAPTKVQNADGTYTTTDYTDNYSKVSSTTAGYKNPSNGAETNLAKVTYSYTGNRMSQILFQGLQDSKQEKYSFEYDDFGNVTSTSVGTKPLVTNIYGANNGVLQRSEYANGDKIHYGYNNAGLVTSIFQDNNGTGTNPTFTWAYTSNGLPRIHKDGVTGYRYDYSYDSIGRLIRTDISNSSDSSFVASTEYGYDVRNNLTSIVNSIGGETYKQIYGYYNTNVGTAPKDTKDNLPTAYIFLGQRVDYAYDDINRLTGETLKITNPTTQQTHTLSKTYEYHNSKNRAGYTTSQLSKETLAGTAYSYTYTSGGNISQVDKNGNVYRKYTYDGLNQLTEEKINNSITNNWSYDGLGNITLKTTTQGSTNTGIKYIYGTSTNCGWNNLLTSVQYLEYNGSTETVTKTENIYYDAIGNPYSYRGAIMGWFGRQMITYSKNGLAYSFTYDADGLRSTKTVGNTKTEYQYVGDKLFYEKRGDNQEFYYFYDSYGKLAAIYYTLVDSTGTSSAVYYVETNSFGDVLRLYSSSAQVVANYEYDAWGNTLSVTDANGNPITAWYHIANANPIRYRGYYYDSETGLYYVSSRYYDPEIGRFISPDTTDVLTATPMGLTDKNLYAYCDNNPVIRADHGGDFWHIVAGAAIGGLIGGISSIVGQAVSGQKINWAEVGVSAASGALTGAITAACPGLGAVATGIVHGVVGAGTHVATELVNGRTPTVAGTLAAGVTSGVLAGGTKAIGNAISSGKLEIGKIKGVRASEGYPGVRYKTNAGPAYSVELHSSHNGHTPHLQVNKWLYQYKGYEGQPYRFRSWHYEFFKPWKGVY